MPPINRKAVCTYANELMQEFPAQELAFVELEMRIIDTLLEAVDILQFYARTKEGKRAKDFLDTFEKIPDGDRAKEIKENQKLN